MSESTCDVVVMAAPVMVWASWFKSIDGFLGGGETGLQDFVEDCSV